MSRRKKSILIAVSVLVLLVGLGLLLYSPVADWINQRNRERMQAAYSTKLENMKNETIAKEKEAAVAYNEKLYANEIKITDPPKRTGYYDQVDLSGNGMMGTIRIPALNISLPIYHGVSDDVLAKGVGHLHQTSLPIGGENTHSALSAHCGLASSSFFTELERLRVGNFFYIDILGETLVYKVTTMEVVYPLNLEQLKIQDGRDLVTLITCTPYGINSHRLLVTGVRVDENDASVAKDMASEGKITGISVRDRFFIIGILIGTVLALMLVSSIVMFQKAHERKKQFIAQQEKKENDQNENETSNLPDGD